MLGLTNGFEGYCPYRKAFAERTYETRITRYEPGVAEKLVETGLVLLSLKYIIPT